MRRPERGITLAEVLVVLFLSSLILAVLGMIAVAARGAYRSASTSYFLSREATTAFAFLRLDLEETSLGTVRAYKDGFTMATGRDPEKGHQLVFTPHGTPKWYGHTCYALEPQGPNTSRLVRWVRKATFADGVPGASPFPPLPLDNAVDRRVVMRNLLSPGFAVRERNGVYEVVADPRSPGGAHLSFVRRSAQGREYSDESPTRYQDRERPGWSEGNTRLVQVDLRILEINEESGRLGYLELNVRVAPGN